MTLVLLSILSVALGVMLITIASSAKTTRDMVQRRSSFYMCDGLGRVVTRLAQDYAKTVAQPNTEDMRQFICDHAGGCTSGNFLPDLLPNNRNFRVTDFEIQALGAATTGPIPNGPFVGMNAQQSTVQILLRAEDTKTASTCATEQEVTLGQIALFQFFMFGDTYTDFHPGPPQDIQGRIHINGNFCAGSQSIFRMERITASGKILSGTDSECEVTFGDFGAQVDTSFVAVGGGFTTFARLTKDNNHGCDPCVGPDDTAANRNLSWQSYALATWAGNVLDSDHNVPTLRPPVTSIPNTQIGANAAGVASANRDNMRFLVDPVLPNDPDDVRAQKFAQKADIRIVNGVWYLRNPNNAQDWPGIPIWSDHAGSFTTTNEEGIEGTQKVGQQDLWNDGNGQGPVNWSSRSGTDKAPQRFSYYRTDVLQKKGILQFQAADNIVPVVSYGSLKREVIAGKTQWKPAHWVGAGTAITSFLSPLCPKTRESRAKMSIEEATATRTLPSGAPLQSAGCRHNVAGENTDCYTNITNINGTNINAGNLASQLGVQAGLRSITESIACDTNAAGVVDNPTVATALLNATRSGFVNTHQMEREQVNSLLNLGTFGKATVLPMNVDVGALQEALQDRSVGELGSYFCNDGNCLMKAPFNGVIYITNTWPNALRGLRDNQEAIPQPPYKQGYVRADRTNSNIARTAAPNLQAGVDDGSIAVDLDQGTFDQQQIAPTYTRILSGTGNRSAAFAQQRALPYYLCSDAASPADTAPNKPFDKTETADRFARFTIPDCARYQGTDGLTARANAVRVFNGARLDETVLPKGLTISTNLPVYLLGEMNTASQVTPSDAEPWQPFLVTGDMAFVLSNAWSDETAGWHTNLSDTFNRRLAIQTQYNMQVLAGWTPSSNENYSGGANNYMRYLECWRGLDGSVPAHALRGSFVMAFNSVYVRSARGSDLNFPQAYCAPIRDWAFDQHLDQISNQPPGAPLFEVTAIRKWERDLVE